MKIQFVIVLILYGLNLQAQSNAECFWKIKKEKLLEDSIRFAAQPRSWQFSYDVESINKDSVMLNNIDSALSVGDKAFKKILGCQFPNDTLKGSDGNQFSLYDIKTDLTILNFAYVDSVELKDLAHLKKDCESISIIVFSYDNPKTKQPLIDRYKNIIVFVFNADNYIQKYSLDVGYPYMYILNRNKIIKYTKGGYFREEGKLYHELKSNMSSFLDSFR